MKILAVNGSPRRGGNTDLLVEALAEGAEGAGATVAKVCLTDLEIAPCDACNGCRTSGECVHDDDMIPLYDKLFESDVWVLGTPVYWWGPSAQLKAFVDRWYRFAGGERWRVKGKRAALLAPFADTAPDTARHIVGMLTDSFRYLKIDFVGQVLATAGERGEIAAHPTALVEARALGRRLAAQG